MKKITVSLLAAMLLISGSTFATDLPVSFKSYDSPSLGIWIKISIIFHRPKTDCKTGFGICIIPTFGTEGGSKSSSETECPVQMMLQGDQLFLEVTEKALATWEQGSTLPYFKGRNSVTFDDPVEIPADLSRKLGSQVPLVIKPGTYPVTVRNGVYTIIFQV